MKPHLKQLPNGRWIAKMANLTGHGSTPHYAWNSLKNSVECWNRNRSFDKSLPELKECINPYPYKSE